MKVGLQLVLVAGSLITLLPALKCPIQVPIGLLGLAQLASLIPA